MKKFLCLVTAVLVIGLIVVPAFAGSSSPRPGLDRMRAQFYEKRGEAVPQTTYNYLFDVVSNAYSYGWGSIVAITNYNDMVRNHIEGYLVPVGANPGEEIPIDIWLNPYEVRYINLGQLGLGDQNGWLWLWSSVDDFGAGVVMYNTSDWPGILWEQGWYWTTN